MTPIRATIEEPQRGTWIADCEFSEPFAGTFTLGGVTWAGAAMPSQVLGGRHRARIIGGNGRLGETIADKWYLGGGSGDSIVGDIARAVGHQVTSNLPQRVPSWNRARMTAGRALSVICDTLGAEWWVGRDGVLRTGAREAGEVSGAFAQVSADTESVTLVGTDFSGVLPGRTWQGQTIRHVRTTLEGDRLSCELSLREWPRRDHIRERDYVTTHRAVVERQHSDGTLDLIVDNRFSLTRIPWLPGVPGTVTLEAGDVVTVASWAGGDPRQWYAVGMARVTGGTPAARVGSAVDCGTIIMAQVPGAGGATSAAVYVPPGPEHDAQVVANTAILSIPPSVIFGSFRLEGVITEGSPRLSIP